MGGGGVGLWDDGFRVEDLDRGVLVFVGLLSLLFWTPFWSFPLSLSFLNFKGDDGDDWEDFGRRVTDGVVLFSVSVFVFVVSEVEPSCCCFWARGDDEDESASPLVL